MHEKSGHAHPPQRFRRAPLGRLVVCSRLESTALPALSLAASLVVASAGAVVGVHGLAFHLALPCASHLGGTVTDGAEHTLTGIRGHLAALGAEALLLTETALAWASLAWASLPGTALGGVALPEIPLPEIALTGIALTDALPVSPLGLVELLTALRLNHALPLWLLGHHALCSGAETSLLHHLRIGCHYRGHKTGLASDAAARCGERTIAEPRARPLPWLTHALPDALTDTLTTDCWSATGAVTQASGLTLCLAQALPLALHLGTAPVAQHAVDRTVVEAVQVLTPRPWRHILLLLDLRAAVVLLCPGSLVLGGCGGCHAGDRQHAHGSHHVPVCIHGCAPFGLRFFSTHTRHNEQLAAGLPLCIAVGKEVVIVPIVRAEGQASKARACALGLCFVCRFRSRSALFLLRRSRPDNQSRHRG